MVISGLFFLVLDPTAGESYKTIVPGARCCSEDSVTVALLELSPRSGRFIYPEKSTGTSHGATIRENMSSVMNPPARMCPCIFLDFSL